MMKIYKNIKILTIKKLRLGKKGCRTKINFLSREEKSIYPMAMSMKEHSTENLSMAMEFIVSQKEIFMKENGKMMFNKEMAHFNTLMVLSMKVSLQVGSLVDRAPTDLTQLNSMTSRSTEEPGKPHSLMVQVEPPITTETCTRANS
jgi:hypothetical protein